MKNQYSEMAFGIFCIMLGILIAMAVLYTDEATERVGHGSPYPSIESVQALINKQGIFKLEIDGVAGDKTMEAWQFYNTGWEAYNQKLIMEKL